MWGCQGCTDTVARSKLALIERASYVVLPNTFVSSAVLTDAKCAETVRRDGEQLVGVRHGLVDAYGLHQWQVVRSRSQFELTFAPTSLVNAFMAQALLLNFCLYIHPQ